MHLPACPRRSGADKVSIGGDAVDAAEEFLRLGAPTGRSSIEQISWHYGAQAVVVSIDPRRVWVQDPATCRHATVRSSRTGAHRRLRHSRTVDLYNRCNGRQLVWQLRLPNSCVVSARAVSMLATADC